MILSDSFVTFWFTVTVLFSFIGQSTVGILLYHYIRAKWFPTNTQKEVQFLNSLLKEEKEERRLAKQDSDLLRKEIQDLVQAFVTRLVKS
jgi:hypothetical protein